MPDGCCGRDLTGGPCGLPVLNLESGEPRCVVHSRLSDRDPEMFLRSLNELVARGCGEVLRYDRLSFPATLSFVDDPVPFKLSCVGCTFLAGISFDSAKFPKGADFTGATFEGRTYFADTSFSDVSFVDARFKGAVHASYCRMAVGRFDRAVFEHSADLSDARFGDVSFRSAWFRDRVDFSLATFSGRQGNGTVDFAGARFDRPDQVRFYLVNQHHGAPGFSPRLRGCNLRGVAFSNAKWRRSEGRIVVADELDADSSASYSEGDYPDTDPTHETAAVVYRQLQTCFEAERDYERAEECIVSVMEMRRRVAAKDWPTRLSIDLYRMASIYGTSFHRALAILATLTFLVFPIAFSGCPANLTARDGTALCKTEWAVVPPSVLEAQGTRVARRVAAGVRGVACVASASLVHSVETATFQRERTYSAAGTVGKLMSALETVLVTGQAALFLLALKRRFRH